MSVDTGGAIDLRPGVTGAYLTVTNCIGRAEPGRRASRGGAAWPVGQKLSPAEGHFPRACQNAIDGHKRLRLKGR
jgi:hypothetical protein